MILDVPHIVSFLFEFIFDEATFTPVLAMLTSDLFSMAVGMFFQACVCGESVVYSYIYLMSNVSKHVT